KDTYLIIKTTTGFAQTVNFYIDQMNLKEVIGTIGGNDTILVIIHSYGPFKYSACIIYQFCALNT
ncbi:hypothetical protein FXV89_06490, partial [Staphylococcus pseudintermedius]|nr:hypothetical protein [Staphylococcus pseudintermedius]